MLWQYSSICIYIDRVLTEHCIQKYMWAFMQNVPLCVFSKQFFAVFATSMRNVLLPQRRNLLELWWILLKQRSARSTRMYLIINIVFALVSTTVVVLLAAEIKKNGSRWNARRHVFPWKPTYVEGYFWVIFSKEGSFDTRHWWPLYLLAKRLLCQKAHHWLQSWSHHCLQWLLSQRLLYCCLRKVTRVTKNFV